MKIRYYVMQLTDEGRLIEPEDSGPYYNRTNPFDTHNGYETEKEAEADLEKCLDADEYPYLGMNFTIVKVYS